MEGSSKWTRIVSIPYRYATNSGGKVYSSHQRVVSIPYRYATNYIKLTTIVFGQYVSIPYRYATNTLFSDGKENTVTSFNPL